MREKEEEGGAKRPTKQTILYFFLVIMEKENVLLFVTHIITLFEKSCFCPKIQFRQNPNIFTSFSLEKIDNFLGESRLNFWKKMKISNSVIIIIFVFRVFVIIEVSSVSIMMPLARTI